MHPPPLTPIPYLFYNLCRSINFRCNLSRILRRYTPTRYKWTGFVYTSKLISPQLGQSGETVKPNITNDLVSQATGICLIIVLLYLYFSYGWLIDATARYPMQTVKSNCGNRTGVIGTTAKRNKTNGRYSAYCYKHQKVIW